MQGWDCVSVNMTVVKHVLGPGFEPQQYKYTPAEKYRAGDAVQSVGSLPSMDFILSTAQTQYSGTHL